MPSVAELTAVYGNFMLGPRRGTDVCARCFNLTDGYGMCYACAHGGDELRVVAPISYSIGHEQLHHVLSGYKRSPGDTARRFTVELAAVLWRHLAGHERCVGAAAGVDAFPLVTTVPSSDPHRDEHHPLRRIVGELAAPTRERHVRLLRRSSVAAGAREFHPDKYAVSEPLSGEPILLIDDTWTTGANAQSAARALHDAGAGPVAVVVIGRYINRAWHNNDRRLQELGRPFDWDTCALCASARAAVTG